jgi:hypothetical protein
MAAQGQFDRGIAGMNGEKKTSGFKTLLDWTFIVQHGGDIRKCMPRLNQLF